MFFCPPNTLVFPLNGGKTGPSPETQWIGKTSGGEEKEGRGRSVQRQAAKENKWENIDFGSFWPWEENGLG